jgi:hypothetical protein
MKRPLWGFRTGSIPHIQAKGPPGYVFTSHCVVHCCRPTNDLWRNLFALPELSGPPEVPSNPSELSPLERYPSYYRSETPAYRFNLSVLPPPKRWAGPTGPGSRVLTLSRVPGDRCVISTSPAGCSLGFNPSRTFRRGPGPGLRPASSHALCESGNYSPDPPAPQSIDQPLLGPVRESHVNTQLEQASPFRVSAPVRS